MDVRTMIEKLTKQLERKKRQKLERLLKEKPKTKQTPTPKSTSPSHVQHNGSHLLDGGEPLRSQVITRRNQPFSKRLKFALQPPRINRFQLKQDLKDFGRRLKLREFFFDPDKNNEEYDRNARHFKPTSIWTPKRNKEAALEAYLQAVEKDTKRLTNSI